MILPQRPITYLITSGEARPDSFDTDARTILDLIADAVADGIDLVQLREKHLTAKQLYSLAEAAAQLTHGAATRLVVNDRSDIAMAVGADGVHLTEASLPVDVLRAKLPTDFLIAASVHSIDGAVRARNGGADLCVFGPVFETPGKSVATGLDELHDVCSAVAPFPVLALGGVDEDNLSSVLAAGAWGIAAIRSLNDARSRKAIIRQARALTEVM